MNRRELAGVFNSGAISAQEYTSTRASQIEDHLKRAKELDMSGEYRPRIRASRMRKVTLKGCVVIVVCDSEEEAMEVSFAAEDKLDRLKQKPNKGAENGLDGNLQSGV